MSPIKILHEKAKDYEPKPQFLELNFPENEEEDDEYVPTLQEEVRQLSQILKFASFSLILLQAWKYFLFNSLLMNTTVLFGDWLRYHYTVYSITVIKISASIFSHTFQSYLSTAEFI